jgi:hypothetical protein
MKLSVGAVDLRRFQWDPIEVEGEAQTFGAVAMYRLVEGLQRANGVIQTMAVDPDFRFLAWSQMTEADPEVGPDSIVQ